MISMLSMSSGLMSLSREATCEFCAPKDWQPAPGSLVDRVVHPDAVDIDDRLGAERKGGAPPDLDGRSGADPPGARGDDGPRRPGS